MAKKMNIGVQNLKGRINEKVVEIYPELEDLVVEPSLEEQKFKSEKYGYNEVTVKAIESEELNITPSAEEQVNEGLFDKVTVAGDSNLVAGNIKQGTSIFGVEGTLSNEPVEKYIVRVIDYDGTIIKEEELSEGEVFTMPSPPQHDNLIFQGWSSPVDIVDNVVIAEDQDIVIGPMYTTVSGASEFDIEVTKSTGLVITISSSKPTGMTNIDWGDGTVDTERTHTYTNYGKYTVKLYGSIIRIPNAIFGTGYNSQFNSLLKKARIAEGVQILHNSSFYYAYTLSSIALPKSIIEIQQYAFSDCYSLKSIILPMNLDMIEGQTGIFSSCYSLEHIVMPKGMTITPGGSYLYNLRNITIPETVEKLSGLSNTNFLKHLKIPRGVIILGRIGINGMKTLNIPDTVNEIVNNAFDESNYEELTIPQSVTVLGTNVFRSSKRLKKVTFLNNLLEIPNSTFSSAVNLEFIDIPDTVTRIGSQAFYTCSSLKNIVFPSNIEYIDSSAFYQCYSLYEYDFSKAKVVPTLANANAFSQITKIGGKIIVPDKLYDEWIAATNWSEYADYIYKASEVLA